MINLAFFNHIQYNVFGRLFFFFEQFGGPFKTFKFEFNFEKIIYAFWKLNIVKGPPNCSEKSLQCVSSKDSKFGH